MTDCIVCSKRRVQDRVACQPCEDRAVSQLRDLPEFYAHLFEFLEPGSTVSDGSKRTKADAAPLPVRLEVLNLRQRGGLVDVLTEWEGAWRDHYLLGPAVFRGDTEQTLTGVVGWLVAWAPRAFVDHPAVDDFAREVRDLHHGCRQLLGDVERTISPGRCPVVLTEDETDSGEPEPCGGRLEIDAFGQGAAYCRDCGAEWNREHLLLLGAQLTDPRSVTA